MTRVRANRYKLSFGQYVGVIVDEPTMKKLSKIQYETREKVLEVLENNPDGHWNYSWSIADQPSETIQSIREFYYIDYDSRQTPFSQRLNNMFAIKKVNNLYDVGDLRWPELSKTAEKEHIAHLKNMPEED